MDRVAPLAGHPMVGGFISLVTVLECLVEMCVMFKEAMMTIVRK